MCLAVPMQIESKNGDTATVTAAGTSRDINISFLEDTSIGDYVLVHAGFAIKRIDEKAAEETAKLLNKMADIAKKDS